MAFPFSSTENNRWKFGDDALYLGRDIVTGDDIGIRTDKHAITVATARSGKGAALIIPNLMTQSSFNALVVDPKGENVEKTWQTRKIMGQNVRVLDPFNVADIPDEIRVKFNILDSIDPKSPTIWEDIRAVADGLVMRYKSEDGMWDNGAVTVLSGFIAHALSYGDAANRTLPAVRSLLRLPDDDLIPVFEAMNQIEGFGGLGQAAAGIGLSPSRKNREFIGCARDNCEWLDSGPMSSMLSSSSFNFDELKHGKSTIYLVLPPHLLRTHGRFLRLFVRYALNVMSKSGLKGERCLFILDEFHSLGRIDELASACGAMPGYGLHLWPFLQDINQLEELYGKSAETFISNSDIQTYFGTADDHTLEVISKKLGETTPEEIAEAPPMKEAYSWWKHGGWFKTDEESKAELAAKQANEDALHRHRMGMNGRRRLSPLEIKELVAKHDGDKVARSMIVIGKGGNVFNLALSPYFSPYTPPPINKENPANTFSAPEESEGIMIQEDFWDKIARLQKWKGTKYIALLLLVSSTLSPYGLFAIIPLMILWYQVASRETKHLQGKVRFWSREMTEEKPQSIGG